jgi:Rrf2 family protein
MKISSKGEYGLRALFDLTQHYKQRPRRSREIAEAQHIAEDYLNQLLITLRRAELINSLRGPQGGHELARDPRQITLYDALRVLEGEISFTDYAANMEPAPVDDVLNPVWQTIVQETIRILQETTLENLRERRESQEQELMYHI